MKEVQKLKAIIRILKTMGHDEQWRTVRYLWTRLMDQHTIADVKFKKAAGKAGE